VPIFIVRGPPVPWLSTNLGLVERHEKALSRQHLQTVLLTGLVVIPAQFLSGHEGLSVRLSKTS
jgi:hypothetical protein